MPANPVRYGVPNSSEPQVHELPPLRHGTSLITVRVEVRRADDGTWRGRLMFQAAGSETSASTSEILCAANENDLWESVRDLRDHHLRDLYRSLVE